MATPHPIAVIVGSLRKESFSLKIANALAKLAPASLKLEIVNLHDISFFNQDLEANPPADWLKFRETLQKSDGVLFVTPEYNSSVPPLLKNTIDWITRVQDPPELRGQVFRERPFAIAAASEGRLGGTRALAALRLILAACHAIVIPNQLALSFADQAYDEMDRLKNPADIQALGALVRQLIDVSQHMM